MATPFMSKEKKMADLLSLFEDFLWDNLGAPIIILAGLYLSYKLRFFQICKAPQILKNFFELATLKQDKKDNTSVHPLKVFFVNKD